MATQLFTTGNDVGIYDPVTRRGGWDKTTGTSTASLYLSLYGMGTGGPTHIVASSEAVTTANYDVFVGAWISDPLDAAHTFGGTVEGLFLMAEQNADANMVLHCHIWVTQGDSDTVRGTLVSDYVGSVEFPVISLGRCGAISLPSQAVGSVNAQAGDRIVLEVGYQAQNVISNSRTGTMIAGGEDGPADGTETPASGTGQSHSGWVQFSDDFEFSATWLYLANAAAPATPPANRGTWDQDSKLDNELARVPTGAFSSHNPAETSATNPWDVLIYRFISPELQAQTIDAQMLAVFMSQIENSTAADAFGKWHAYVMASDGSVRGTLVSNEVQSPELSTISVRSYPSPTCSSVVCSAGDRIVFEAGARFTNALTTSYNSTIVRGGGELGVRPGASAVASVGTTGSTGRPNWIKFMQHLLWLDDLVATGFTQFVIAG